VEDNFSGSSSKAKAEFFKREIVLTATSQHFIYVALKKQNTFLNKYLWFHVIERFLLLIICFLMLQDHTVDAVFNFLTTVPSEKTDYYYL